MTLENLLKTGMVLGSVLALSACAQTDSSGDPDQDTDALSTSSRTFVTAQRDLRKCASPKCGGWFVQDVNRANPTPRYVSGFDFAHASDLDDAAVQQVLDAPDGELVLRGKLGPESSSSHTRKFLVYEAYRGMPGFGPATGDSFIAVEQRDPQIQCFTAPCNNLVSHELNHTPKTNFTRTDAELGSFIDAAWLENRVDNGGAIVAGSLVAGDTFPGGAEKVLHASQVFLKLPEVAGPCPTDPTPSCSPEAATFTRTADRCVVFDACVQPGFCPLFVPACSEGYTLTSWRGGVNACSVYACDPTWLDEGN